MLIKVNIEKKKKQSDLKFDFFQANVWKDLHFENLSSMNECSMRTAGFVVMK